MAVGTRAQSTAAAVSIAVGCIEVDCIEAAITFIVSKSKQIVV